MCARSYSAEDVRWENDKSQTSDNVLNTTVRLAFSFLAPLSCARILDVFFTRSDSEPWGFVDIRHAVRSFELCSRSAKNIATVHVVTCSCYHMLHQVAALMASKLLHTLAKALPKEQPFAFTKALWPGIDVIFCCCSLTII